MISSLRYLGKVETENSFYWNDRGENIFEYNKNEYRLFIIEIRVPSHPSTFPGVKMFTLRSQSLSDNTISWYSLPNVKILQGPDGFFTFKYMRNHLPGLSNNTEEPIIPMPEKSSRELNRLFSPTLREEKLADLGI